MNIITIIGAVVAYAVGLLFVFGAIHLGARSDQASEEFIRELERRRAAGLED